MTPAPSLLADPSSPSAYRVREGGGNGSAALAFVRLLFGRVDVEAGAEFEAEADAIAMGSSDVEYI